MTFRDYITLDGLKFKTPQKAWRPVDYVPATVRRTLAGDADATFGPAAFFTWEGEIEAPPVAPVGWGTYADLKVFRRRKAAVAFEDHYGAAYSVIFQGPFPERSLLPVWDDPANIIFVGVKLVEA